VLYARFVFMCCGYYSGAQGHRPEFADEADFRGTVVHPQFWPEDLDYAAKRVVVIGSGATAVTLVPEIAKTAAHVTMLQRSPSYVVSRPSEDRLAHWLRRYLPSGLAHGLARWNNVLLGMFFYQLARRRPEQVKRRLIDMVLRSAALCGYIALVFFAMPLIERIRS
jgi:monooxygenase